MKQAGRVLQAGQPAVHVCRLKHNNMQEKTCTVDAYWYIASTGCMYKGAPMIYHVHHVIIGRLVWLQSSHCLHHKR